MTKNTIAEQLTLALSELDPKFLQLENESHHHAGHFEGKESHFKLVIVSATFAGKSLVARHQLIYKALDQWLVKNGGCVHALALHTYTPDEWANVVAAPNSPLCAGKNQSAKHEYTPTH